LNVEYLLEYISKAGGRMEITGDNNLRVIAPQEVLTEELKEQLKTHKREILNLLRNPLFLVNMVLSGTVVGYQSIKKETPQEPKVSLSKFQKPSRIPISKLQQMVREGEDIYQVAKSLGYSEWQVYALWSWANKLPNPYAQEVIFSI